MAQSSSILNYDISYDHWKKDLHYEMSNFWSVVYAHRAFGAPLPQITAPVWWYMEVFSSAVVLGQMFRLLENTPQILWGAQVRQVSWLPAQTQVAVLVLYAQKGKGN